MTTSTTVKLRLFNYWRSSSSYRVRIALELKNIEYTYVPVNLIAENGGEHRGEAYRAQNAMAQVPLLEIDEGDGAPPQRIPQSVAIFEYLEERFASDARAALLPRDVRARAKVRALVEIVNSGIQPLQNLNVTRRIAELGGDPKAWAAGFIEDGLNAFDALLTEAGSNDKYCIGDTFTLADCCLIPQLHAARRVDVVTERWPRLAAIEAHSLAHPAFRRAHPDQQPDAPRPA
ncbi:MAG: maleylacetoacetate isomerase [Deltaproteobacteria bacterium]|nr:maleylacetoacetate isomerase [Deltaproteobacteria bacterium]